MIGLSARVDVRAVRRALRQTRARGPKITAQELNVQRRQSRTRITRIMVAGTGIKARRIRNRVLLPRTGLATPRRLSAIGIALVHNLPARWFLRGRGKRQTFSLPSGMLLLEGAAAVGRAFVANTARGPEVFRRGADPRTRGTAEDPTWLPIKAQHVDSSALGNFAIQATLRTLRAEWRDRFARRMERELRRIWGRARRA